MDLVYEKSVDLMRDYVWGDSLPSFMADGTYAHEYVVFVIMNVIGGYVLYLLFASVSFLYFFVLFREKYNPNYKLDVAELRAEISQACFAIPVMAVITAPLWMLDVRHTYSGVEPYGIVYLVFSVVWFLCFTDFCIYWLHRWLHHPAIYALLHKRHHQYIAITPFASHAFNPFDACIQALPYHVYCALFPFNNWALLGMFLFVNFWTISIHDRVRFAEDSVVLGAAHHLIHHSHFVFNYGQYTTVWDRIGNTYLDPSDEKMRAKRFSELGEELKSD